MLQKKRIPKGKTVRKISKLAMPAAAKTSAVVGKMRQCKGSIGAYFSTRANSKRKSIYKT